MGDELWVVMPVYNEGAAVEVALREWMPAVRVAVPHAAFCVVDDGSTDETPAVLTRVAAAAAALRVVGSQRGARSGVRYRLSRGPRWGRALGPAGGLRRPVRRATLRRPVERPPRCSAVLGRRRRRETGWSRTVISRALGLVVCAATGRRVRDANSPYRLMRADVLAAALPRVPPDVYLTNVLVAVDLAARAGITWVDVGFRRRFRPSPFRPRYFLTQASGLWRDLRRWRSDTRRARSRATRSA